MASPNPANIASLLIITIIIVSLPALHLSQAAADEQIPTSSYDGQGTTITAGDDNVQDGKIDCGGKCKVRCQLASRHKMCIRACGTCCQRCNCVPPGTSGNRDVCPCYAKMTTHGGRLKCP